MEQGDSLKRNLLQKWADHGKYLDLDDGKPKEISSRNNYGNTEIKDKFKKFFHSSMTKYGRKKKLEPEMAPYEFNEKTFELKIRHEKNTSRMNTARNSKYSLRKNRNKASNSISYQTPTKSNRPLYLKQGGIVEGKVPVNFLPQIESGVCILDEHVKANCPPNRKLSKLKVYIYEPLKTLILTELKNLRWLKIASRLVSGEASFKKSKIFRMMDFENQGTISINNIKQYCLKHDRPLNFSRLKLLFRRMKVGL